MAARGTTRAMSEKHEADAAEFFGGRMTKSSGAVLGDRMDVRGDHLRDDMMAFAYDAKSTMGKGITVTREMWDKAMEQAGYERPGLLLRWYTTTRLDVGLDLVVTSWDDHQELRERGVVW